MKVQKLVVHHSASDSATTKKGDIERWHKQRGFSQIGYHKVIEGNGAVVDGRSEKIKGAHAKGANHASLGVCVAGNFETNSPSSKQVDALVTVLTGWCKTHSLTSANIYPHSGVPGGTTKTSCPGKNLQLKLAAIKQKVTENLKKK